MGLQSQLDEEASSQAAELALGLLEGAERRRAERRVHRDGRFRIEVAMWQTHFADLLEPSMARPPPETLGRIEDRMFGRSARHRLRRATAWVTDILTPGEIVVVLALKAGFLLSLAVWLL